MASYNFKDIIGRQIQAVKNVAVYDEPDGNILYNVKPGLLIGTATNYTTVDKDSWSWIKVWEIIVDRWVWYQIDNTGKWFKYDETPNQVKIADENSNLEITTAVSKLEDNINHSINFAKAIVPVALIFGAIILYNQSKKK